MGWDEMIFWFSIVWDEILWDGPFPSETLFSDLTRPIIFKNLQKYEYQEQKAEVQVIGADGSIFVSNTRERNYFLNPPASLVIFLPFKLVWIPEKHRQ